MQVRKVDFRLYPSVTQTEALMARLMSDRILWNAALLERIDAWQKSKKHITYSDQCASLTQIRRELPEEWAIYNCSSQQITLRRLDKAFTAFFRRIKSGQKPGFPRFKSIARMPGFGFKSHGDGWRFTPNVDAEGKWTKHGTLRLQGIGHIKARGQARLPGTIKSCELMHRHGQWSLSLTIEVEDEKLLHARPRHEHHAMAADWGVNTLLSIVRTNGASDQAVENFENPRWYKSFKEKLISADRQVSQKKRGSRRWKKAAITRSKLKAKISRKRHDHQHKLSNSLALRCAIFATEELSIKNMTASAAGTVEEPGRNVAQKAGLNREILDTAPAALLQKIFYKVQETGGMTMTAPTRKLKPSQTCPACHTVNKKTLDERTHHCETCGYTEDRDLAAARVVLQWAIGQDNKGWEPPLRP